MKWLSNIKLLWTIIAALIGYNYWLHEDVSNLKQEAEILKIDVTNINHSILMNQRQAIWDLQDSLHSIDMRLDKLIISLNN
jgi:hypothetical protein